MNSMAIIAALGVLVIASPAFFFFGRGRGVALGKRAELERQAAAKATAEETATRIVAEAEREVVTMRKSAVVTGKEEVMRLREEAGLIRLPFHVGMLGFPCEHLHSDRTMHAVVPKEDRTEVTVPELLPDLQFRDDIRH